MNRVEILNGFSIRSRNLFFDKVLLAQVGREVGESYRNDQSECDIEATEVLLASGLKLCEEETVDSVKESTVDALEVGKIVGAGCEVGDEEDRGRLQG